jgi:hypothetical protein
MLHCSLLDSGVCVMHMFSSLDMALDIQSAARHWIHVVHVRGQKLRGTAQSSNQRQSPRAARDHRRDLALSTFKPRAIEIPTAIVVMASKPDVRGAHLERP